MATLKFDDPAIWQICRDNFINADGNDDITFVVTKHFAFFLVNSGNSAVPTVSRCLLIAPEIIANPPRGWIINVTRYASKNQIALTFQISDAARYEKVFVVGNVDVNPLINAQGPKINRSQHSTSWAKLKQELEAW